MNLLNTFTSTGWKLFFHPKILEKCPLGKGIPLSLQIAPTSRCNLNCCFCSNVNRNKYETLESSAVVAFLKSMWLIGSRTIEWTGGGDPTMHPDMQSMILSADSIGYEQGMITNGIALKEMDPSVLNKLKWLRVSMNSLDYVSDIQIPDISGVLGFSYVINQKTNGSLFLRLKDYVKKYNPLYVRIVPNCQCSYEEQEINNRELPLLVEKELGGPPFFYQPKNFSKPERCWWGNFKPFLLHDGYIYPCSSVVLNYDAERSFHERYRWKHMDEFPEYFSGRMVPFSTTNCSHCVFGDQNSIIDMLMCGSKMRNFL